MVDTTFAERLQDREDTELWAQFYAYWTPRFRSLAAQTLKTYCKRKGLDLEQEIYDCSQSIWVVVWTEIQKGKALSKSYVKKIALTCLLKHIREGNADIGEPNNPFEYIELERDLKSRFVQGQGAVDPQEQLEARSLLKTLQVRFRGQLTPTEREVFNLMVQDKDYEEMARELETSNLAVRLAVLKVRGKLQHFVEGK
jgi:DNA-directed RNA polymerase specialized sigma24 family protein